MALSASSRDDSQERKSLLDKSNSSEKPKSGEKNSNTEKSNKTEKSSKLSESAKSSKTAEKSERPPISTQRSTTSLQSVGRRGPKMSDGTEFDTGPYGYVFSFIYLFVLWGLAVIVAVALISYNYVRLDPQYPSYFGEGSFLGGVPKATFDPNPRRFQEEGTKNLMEWNIYDFKSYLNLLIRYKQLLKNYSIGGKDKNLCRTHKMNNTKACRFDRITDFGDCVLSHENLETGFGYSKGQPCIMLKINKIVGWVPQFNNETECPPDNLCCGPGIQFQCESDDDVNFEYYPKNGIPACYFPYANQKGYEQPYQMVKVANLTFNKETTIECFPKFPSSLKQLNGNSKRNEARFHILMKQTPPADSDY